MNYEQKYKDALERAKKLSIDGYLDAATIDEIFPELKESEDEGIKTAILNHLKKMWGNCQDDVCGVNVEDAIAWLEKQDNKRQVEHLELKAGHWYICHRPYCCRADSLTIKEGERFKCEKDGVVNGFVIKEPEKYFMEISVPPHSEDTKIDEVRRRSTIQVLEYARSLDTYNQYGKADIDKNIAWLEKKRNYDRLIEEMKKRKELLSKEKEKATSANDKLSLGGRIAMLQELLAFNICNTTYKVEPKFKVGDWIVDDEAPNDVFCVIEVLGEIYKVIDIDGDDYHIPHCKVNKQFHLWTIDDAQEGDVLVNGSNIFIFHFINDTRLMGYCHVNIDNGRFYDDLGKNECFCTIDAEVTPATKEQHDLLFQKMKNDGYEWNAENKELSKQTLKITPKFCVGQLITDDNGTWYQITNIKCLDDWYYEVYDICEGDTHLELCSIIDEKFRENRFVSEIKKMIRD